MVASMDVKMVDSSVMSRDNVMVDVKADGMVEH